MKKNHTLVGGLGCGYACAAVAGGDMCKRRQRNDGLLYPVFRGESDLRDSGRSVRGQADKRYVGVAGHYRGPFPAGAWLCVDMGEKAFVFYALGYLALGSIAMLVSARVKKIR